MNQMNSARALDQQASLLPRTPLQQKQFLPTLDVLLVNTTDLLPHEARTAFLQRLHLIAQHTKREHYRGPWVLALTHTPEEQIIAYRLTSVLTTRTSLFQGVVAVQQRRGENALRIARALHRLHFPLIRRQDRGQHILVMSSGCERELLQLLGRGT